MPLLRHYTLPPFGTFGEAIECARQLFEVRLSYSLLAPSLTFTRVCISCTSTVLLIGEYYNKYFELSVDLVFPSDCSSRNIMMDPSRLFIDAFHPASPLMKRNFSEYARHKTRTERPPKYFLIDFGLSRRYDDSIVEPLEDPIWGADKEVPEFQNSNAPCDPFPTDVFYIGNTIRKDFIEVCRVVIPCIPFPEAIPVEAWVRLHAASDSRHGSKGPFKTSYHGSSCTAV